MFDAEVLEVSHGMLAAVRDIRLLSLPGPASKLKKGTEDGQKIHRQLCQPGLYVFEIIENFVKVV